MIEFALVTRWLIPAPIERVWSALYEVQTWPMWWPHVKRVTDIEAGDAIGVGARRHLVWATRLPYRIAFDVRVMHVEPQSLIEARAQGDLNGVGRWLLRPLIDSTLVWYDWRVSVDKTWMKLLAPVLYPVFVWNHNDVMRAGKHGLLRHLGVYPRRADAGVDNVERD